MKKRKGLSLFMSFMLLLTMIPFTLRVQAEGFMAGKGS